MSGKSIDQMRDFVVAIPKDKRPLYLRITAAVRGGITAGLVESGELLPSCRVLAAQIRVNRHTVMAALDQLVAEGWVHAEPRKGYRVAAELPTRFFTAKEAAEGKGRPKRVAARAVAATSAKATWDFRSGRPDLRLFPVAELKASLNEALRRNAPAALLDYGEPAGHPPFIRELHKYLRRVRALVGRHLIVTHGSQEAIFVTAQALLKRGDHVAVEELCYPSARSALASSGAVLHPVAIDPEGLDPEAFARLCGRRRLKLVYLTPLHHYPTTVTLTSPRRLAIYAIAAKHGVAILEDDYDHEYHYRCQPLAPMAANDPAELVVYVSTLSKVLFPSARLGFAVVPERLAAEFLRVRTMVTTQNDNLLQDAVARWMRTDGFQRHLNRTRRAYERRLQDALVVLEQHRSAGLDLTWRVPDGGMAIWLGTPWDTGKLAAAAEVERILVQPEGPARMDGRPGRHLRLGFAGHTADEFASGVERLFHIGSKLPRYRRKPRLWVLADAAATRERIPDLLEL